MSSDRMMRQAFNAILNGDLGERDRLVEQMQRTHRDPWSNFGTETDKSMTQEVTKLATDFTKLLQAQCPGLFSGDARDSAIATPALAEALGGVTAAVGMHGGQERMRSVGKLFSERATASAESILARTLRKAQ
jgi:hypothetical protein